MVGMTRQAENDSEIAQARAFVLRRLPGLVIPIAGIVWSIRELTSRAPTMIVLALALSSSGLTAAVLVLLQYTRIALRSEASDAMDETQR
jgi:uncharacterized membrane protein